MQNYCRRFFLPWLNAQLFIMKTIIITGAAGQLGTTVTNHFLEKGFRVIATVHGGANELPAAPHLQVEQVDLTNEAAAGTLVKKIAEQQGHIDAALLLAGGF